MAFDESLAGRIRDTLARIRGIEEKKMFRCIYFLNGNALAGAWKDRLITRLGPDEGDAALREPHVRAFDITGKPMRNWVAVEPEGVEEYDQLNEWMSGRRSSCGRCLRSDLSRNHTRCGKKDTFTWHDVVDTVGYCFSLGLVREIVRVDF